MEDDVIIQIQNRIKALLFDDKIIDYREHEYFSSLSGQKYQFLIWKLQPGNWEEFSKEMQNLHENKGYQSIPGACDVSTYDLDKKTGYKVLALYMPNESQ